MIIQEKGDGKAFVSHAPGYWSETSQEHWNDWKWQLKNRVTSLAQLEKHLKLGDEERTLIRSVRGVGYTLDPSDAKA